MSALLWSWLAGLMVWLCGYWFGACMGYRRRMEEETTAVRRAVGRGSLSQSEYTEWLMREHAQHRN